MKKALKKSLDTKFSIQYVSKDTFIGLGIIIGVQILKILFFYIYYGNLTHHLSAKALASRMNHPDPVIGSVILLLNIMSIGSFLYGGFIGAKHTKTQSWIAGALVGISWDILLLLYAILSTLAAAVFPSLFFGTHITGNQLASFRNSIPIRISYAFVFAFINFSIPLTALGGLLLTMQKKKMSSLRK